MHGSDGGDVRYRITDDAAARYYPAVFSTTFLGHQGWMFQTPNTAVLVDPLLCEDFGHAHALGYRVWPPRVWTTGALPPIDAVVLSHEHDDHFDIPSLAKLARTIPIYLSVRSSTAARTILETMGFTVHALVPGVPVQLGDLEVLPFAGDHVGTSTGDEWDTLPFLVRSTEGHGSLFSMVDIPITQLHVEWAAGEVDAPGTRELDQQRDGLEPHGRLSRRARRGHAAMLHRHGRRPQADHDDLGHARRDDHVRRRHPRSKATRPGSATACSASTPMRSAIR